MIRKLCYIVVLVLFATACNSTKFVPEGDLLYTGATVKVVKDSNITNKQRKLLQAKLKEIPRPLPNKKFLGVRYKLFFYNLAGEPKKEKGFRHWLKTSLGEAPVLFSQVDLEYNRSLLQNFSENNGYFNTRTSADSTRHGRRATAEYKVNAGKQYKIKSVEFPSDSSVIGKAVARTYKRGSDKTTGRQNIKDKKAKPGRVRSLLKVGDPYSLDNIKLERKRIDTRLKEKGFYYFNEDYILVQVDSTVGKYEVDLKVKVKDEAPVAAKTPYKINRIIIYPNYSINNDTMKTYEKYKDLRIIGNDGLFKPRVWDRTLYFKRNDLYNRTNHNLTLNRLVNLGTFKFVKNQFKESDTIGNYLDAYYYLTPLERKSIRVEILAKTNSANYTGSELKINWSNRNTFHGAELLTISTFGGVEVQLGGKNNGFNVFRYGGEASLTWPRFISPFRLKSSSGFVPRTNATIGYEFQNRMKLYSLQTFKGSFGYGWKEDVRKEHQLNITEISYVRPQNVTDLYQEQVDLNPSLKHVIEKQLIFGPTYYFTYTNEMNQRRKNTFYYKGGIDLSGNIAGLVTGADIKKGDTIKIFDIAFSQFVKIQNEFKHTYKFNKTSLLKSRIIIGAAFAYGNSDEIPFSKQFFIGGTNSLRAFRSRSLGPGSYDGSNEVSEFIPDQSGDVKLEFNTEYRTDIYKFIKGALFLDAGNIWLINKDIDKPGSQFTKDFMKDIAVGIGAGLRFDFSFLVLRTDLAFPIRKPFLPNGQRWVLDEVNFGSGSWRKSNLLFNLAIGYPF
ncbi:translocation and assembly module lipoprotein TamL [Flavobacterium wongokense]|uniref:translocation and assembly module lipoprotein TamL n=1 Tax=Flavobacterium wongokense TaxID=2910674 RepID=UPI001F1DE13D|nr:BamA/TamA family outer membrane protein [Flavobacterium sp. WG47]MCF6132293.1 BamA/TamA family outer membrane protein [Flavobacterium sp. WG47]